MTAGLIIVSGRTGAADGFDPFMQIGSISAVRRMILVMREAGIGRVVLVTSDNLEALEKHVARMGAVCLCSGDREAEMLQNIKTGLRYLSGICDRVFITPADVPLFSDETLRVMAAEEQPAVVPVYGGKPGHPILISSSLFLPVIGYEGEGGLSGAVKSHGVPVLPVEVPDAGILYNTRSDEDWDRLAEQHVLRKMRPEIRISLARDQAFYGPGTQTLLELVSETGSIRAAAARMGISYSKGWRMVLHMEDQLGYSVISRKQGGKQGGSSELTAEGHHLLLCYRAFLEDCQKEVKRLFRAHFGQE